MLMLWSRFCIYRGLGMTAEGRRGVFAAIVEEKGEDDNGPREAGVVLERPVFEVRGRGDFLTRGCIFAHLDRGTE